jgi:triosephosphate isomerase
MSILFVFCFLTQLFLAFSRFQQKKLIIGNWKSFVSPTSASQLAYSIHQSFVKTPLSADKQVVLLPSLLQFADIHRIFSGTEVGVGTQHCSEYPAGAYTGEVSAHSLKEAGCDYCLVGHNERRQYCGEGEFHFYERTLQLLANGIVPVYCVGDTYEDLNDGNTVYTCLSQIRGLVSYLLQHPEIQPHQISQIVFVYEPTWAIGTGLTPDGAFADQVYCSIHSFLSHRYRIQPTILYGGSVKRDNLNKMRMYDGLLVGKSSVSADTFVDICRNF